MKNSRYRMFCFLHPALSIHASVTKAGRVAQCVYLVISRVMLPFTYRLTAESACQSSCLPCSRWERDRGLPAPSFNLDPKNKKQPL